MVTKASRKDKFVTCHCDEPSNNKGKIIILRVFYFFDSGFLADGVLLLDGIEEKSSFLPIDTSLVNSGQERELPPSYLNLRLHVARQAQTAHSTIVKPIFYFFV